MGRLQDHLKELRERVALIDAKYRRGNRALAAPRQSDSQRYIEDWLGGEVVETVHGRHFETEKLYARHARHGSAEIGALADLPADLLETITDGLVLKTRPQEWAFLDTETTGLVGGAGACAFLVGVGRITPEGFRVRQFFMRDYTEEASLLDALVRHLEPFRVLITYNGRAFDQPLLEARYRLRRVRPPFPRMEHLDLLHGARRLWKLRFERCRLVDLETEVLGVERQGDVPGALIPYVYFEYLHTRQAARLLPVFHHNATDILTLACLTAIVPFAFRSASEPSGGVPFRHGAEMVGIARWLEDVGDLEHARLLFRRAVDAGLPDHLLFRTLWDIAKLERKLGAAKAAVAVWTDLAQARNPFRVRALEALAKHYEHREENHTLALEMTRAALGEGGPASLRRREERLVRRLERTARGAR